MAEQIPNNLKLRFKGVENFLRRIAFNLGNSPSQTEVKIISCIPIDVTDLQQKIIDLERVVTKLHKPPAIVHTALCEQNLCESTETPGLQERDLQQQGSLPESTACDNILKDVQYLDGKNIKENIRQKKSLIFKVSSKHVPVQKNTILEKPEVKLGGNTISSSLITFLNGNCEKIIKKNFFKKSRKKQDKRRQSKPKSHMVFYAQTDNSPFKIRKQVEKKNILEKKLEKINKKKATRASRQSYLTDVVRKQYEPLMRQLSGESDFTSPICRDLEYSCFTEANGSDICSCCRNNEFLNLDNGKASQDFGLSPTFQDQINSKNMYYDSSLYDLVPVKEAPAKTKKNLELQKPKKIYRNDIDFSNYIDYCNNRPYDRAVYVNYHTIIPKPKVVAQNIPRRAPARKTCKRKPLNRRIDIYNEATGSIQDHTSNSCRIECGEVYKKPICKKPEPPQKMEVQKHTITYNDAETATFNNTECQTVTTTQSTGDNLTPSDDKTEETLNQIKSILQSVLTEVKTNSKLKSAPEEKLKRDAVVQKGASFGVMPGSSRFLNSYSYGNYNSGSYGPSCSYPMNSGQQWPYAPKYMHNFPVFIQTPGRLPCNACYKQAMHVPKPSVQQPARKATRAATKTNINGDEPNNETDTLIKEIYKSIALNINVPKKENSTSNCSTTWKQRSSRTSTKSSHKTDKTARQGYAEACTSVYGRRTTNTVPMSTSVYGRHTSNTVPLGQLASSSQSTKRNMRNSMPLTPFSSNTFSNKMTSNTVSVQSHPIGSTKAVYRTKNNKYEHYLDTTQETASDEEIEVRETTKRVVPDRRATTASTATGITADTSSDDTDESDQTTYHISEKNEKKKGLFSKMFQSVKLFKNRNKSVKSKMDTEEDEDSDSDGYQTIYSQKVRQPRRRLITIHTPGRKIPHSKVSYSRHMRGRNQEKLRRSPMEQEYRRQWNEQLMYQQRPPRYSTDTTPQCTDERSYRGSQRYRNKMYYQPVLKPVMVEQGVPQKATMFQDILTTLPMKKKPPQRLRAGPPKGMSWFQRRMHCGQNIVRTLIEDN